MTRQELVKQRADNALALVEAHNYLKDTDWVIVKINEVNVRGVDTTDLLTKYADILSNRESKRLLINEIGA